LEGAAWDLDRGELRAQDPKVLVVELPIMQVRNPLQTTTHRPCKRWILPNALFLLCFALQVIPIEASKLKLHNTFRTPVYVTQARRNAMGVGLVFEADLATSSHSSHWVLQGVCLCLNTDA
jgi:dynein heavy chain